ncbi:MAG: cytidylate kinase-like family protein [Desulfobacteraceae bacterium]|nr:MAG: cytidylate kinase-like family protein [Desulfobacteraceae bacterium]
MKTSRRSIEKIVEDQILQWNRIHAEKKEVPKGVNVITISRESGSGGTLMAAKLARDLEFDLFHREVIQEMAESANISARIVETLDEKGLSVLEDSIAAMIRDRHLWPDEFMRHLLKVVGTLGKHGRAVIVGRGAQYILPFDQTLKVRVIAPLALRIYNVAHELDIEEGEAEKMILKTDADRRSFSRKYFYADVSEPLQYDLIINTARVSVDAGVEVVKSALRQMNGREKIDDQRVR